MIGSVAPSVLCDGAESVSVTGAQGDVSHGLCEAVWQLNVKLVIGKQTMQRCSGAFPSGKIPVPLMQVLRPVNGPESV